MKVVSSQLSVVSRRFHDVAGTTVVQKQLTTDY